MTVIRTALLALLCLTLALPGAALAETTLTGGKAEIPALDIERRPVPDNEAMRFLQDMGTGWNLGNTFDAFGDVQDEMTLETYWCGVETTEGMIDLLAKTGFRTLRLPVSWHDHVSGEDFAISAAWLDRVQQVADWALARGMVVILNTHHDVDPAYYYPDEAHYASSERYITAVWRQLAERFRDYDEHLIFESMNEPRLKDTKHEWWFNPASAACVEAAECINRLNQAFVDTVRESGGANATRYLMVPAYDASPDTAVGDFFRLPEDKADNRLIVSVHAYTPYNFALDAGGVNQFSVSSTRSTGDIDKFMNALYNKYIAQGVPVVIGEYGARLKGMNLQDRVNFAAYYVASATARGIPCCWWDNNAFGGSGENFGLLRRAKENWLFPDIVLAILQYAPKAE